MSKIRRQNFYAKINSQNYQSVQSEIMEDVLNVAAFGVLSGYEIEDAILNHTRAAFSQLPLGYKHKLPLHKNIILLTVE